MAPTKTTKKNGFILFIEERMEELKHDGTSFPGGVKDAIPELSLEWEKLTADKKLEYKKAAETFRKSKLYTSKNVVPQTKLLSEEKRHDLLAHDDDTKKTTFGFTLGQIREIQRRKLAKKIERTLQCKALSDIKMDGDPRTKQIILVKFSPYCYTDEGDYIPAEIGMVTFSLQDGIIDNYSALIDPGEPPCGSRFECMNTSNANGLPVPPYSAYCRDYERILKEIQNYIDSHPPCLRGTRLLFCTRLDIAVAESCFKWLYNACEIPEPEEKYALRPIGLLFLNMYRGGSEFHDKVKEAEKLLPATQLPPSSQLFYKCGVPFYNIKDGRIRTRRLDFYDGLQVYEELEEDEEEPEEQFEYDDMQWNDRLGIIGSAELTLVIDPHENLVKELGTKQWNIEEPSDMVDQDKAKREARNNFVSQYRHEKQTTPRANAEFQTILEESEDEDERTDTATETEKVASNGPSTPGQDQSNKSKYSNHTSHSMLKSKEDEEKIPEHQGPNTNYCGLKAGEKEMYFVLQSGKLVEFENESPNAFAELKEIVSDLKDVDPISDWVFPMECDIKEYWLDEFIKEAGTRHNEGEAKASEEPKDKHDKETGATKKNENEDEGGSTDMKIRQSRKSIWSEPLGERKPGDPEKYGDIDPLLSILWEGDAMEYLRSLDCAYIAEICCPHHAVNNDAWENCPLNLMNRIALNFLDVLIGFWSIVPVEGKHYPSCNAELEGQKRMDWSKNTFGHQQYGYKDLPGFKNSGEFKSDDVKAKN